MSKLNKTYREMAEYCDVAVIPARVRRPKDKPKVKKSGQFGPRSLVSLTERHSQWEDFSDYIINKTKINMSSDSFHNMFAMKFYHKL